jgi:L-lactate utilization protein LutC
MNSRDAILLKLKASVPGHHDAGFVPQRDAFTEESGKNPLDRYTELALAEGTTLAHVEAHVEAKVEAKSDARETIWEGVQAEVASYLQASGLAPRIVIDSRAPLTESGWSKAGVATVTPPLNADGDILVSDCYGAVAESGAIVISTNDGTAIANDFLAETHIVLLRAERIFPSLADLWQALRIDAGDGPMPREFCLVTGPSRTADLGVPAKMGAHGPARVHVIIVDT